MIDISIVFLFCVIAYALLLLKFTYLKIKNHPKGPIPVPIFGNTLLLRGEKKHPMESMMNLSQKYGSVYTFWLGNSPIVFIHDLELAKKAFNMSSFAGRPQVPFIKLFCDERGTDVLFADYCKSWRCLRNVTHSAVRKYAVADNFSIVTSELIDEIVQQMLNKEGIDRAFNPSNYIQLTLYNIICFSVFGKKYTFTDPEFLELDKISKTIFDFGNKFAIVQFIPISGILLLSQIKKIYKTYVEYKKYIFRQFRAHKQSYDECLTRDLTDSLISAKNEAIVGEKDSASYLTDYSLMCSLWDLLFAGIDTTQITLQWMILFIANYPKIQFKLRKEIEDIIGDRMPIQDDINSCHYLNAFISESLRFRNVLPFSVPHKTTTNIEINGLEIPANTTVVIHQHFILNDPKYWKDPEIFNPDRFLDDEIYVSVRPPAFIPFSIGQRKCLGEKLAITNLFLILVRFLQSTNGYYFTLLGGEGSADLNPNPNTAVQFSYPKPYKIILKKNE